MVNVVITSTANTINVVFNDASSMVGMNKGTWSKSEIASIREIDSVGLVEVQTKDETKWTLSYNSNGVNLQIDLINGVAPTSNVDLYNKMIALIA